MKKISLILTLVLCAVMMMPMAYASEGNNSSTAPTPENYPQTSMTDWPKLPEVYDGGTVGSSSRRHYTEETRPEDSSPLNSVTDNPEYGDEFNFLTITNTATGEAWRAGTMELIPGDQYLVEVYCRNDSAGGSKSLNYSNIQLKVEMPYELAMGDLQPISARLTVASIGLNISASVNVVAREAVSLLYVSDTAQSTGHGGTRALNYEEIFGEGANIVPYSKTLSAGNYRIASFTIQVLENKYLVPVDDGFDFDGRLSPAGTGFTTTAAESVTVGGTEVVPEGAEQIGETTQKHDVNYYVSVVIGSIIGACVICLAVHWWRKNHGYYL